MGRLIATRVGSSASLPMSSSAGGHDEQPWLVKSSMTARGSAVATVALAPTTAQTTANATQHRPMPTGSFDQIGAPDALRVARLTIVKQQFTRHSIRGEEVPENRKPRAF